MGKNRQSGKVKMQNVKIKTAGITKYFNEVKQDFHVFGMLDGEWHEFEKGIDYTAFVVKRK